MTEEQVTKAILKWLIEKSWTIISFDFPQSGTGMLLKPNNSVSSKNKESFIPDIIAIKNSYALFFENKNRLYYPDFTKINNLIEKSEFSFSIDKVLAPYSIKSVYYGIGLPTDKYSIRVEKLKYLVDFIIGVDSIQNAEILYNPKDIDF